MTRQQEHFRCSYYKSGRGECQIHFIRDVVLERIVFEAISNLSDFVRCYESVFLYLMATKKQTVRKTELQKLKNKVESGKRRISELDVIISRIYNDKYDGHCHVKVDIYFTAIGIIDIPDEKDILDIVHKIQENPQMHKVG